MKFLSDKTLLITKAKAEAEKVFGELSGDGMDIIYFPTIKIVPKTDSQDLAGALVMFDEFDYLIFTSPNAVEIFYNIALSRQLEFSKVKVAATGNSTAEKCRQYEINVDVVPGEFSAKGIINRFSSIDLTDKKIFIPGSSLSRDELANVLSGLGAQVITAPIYDTVLNDRDILFNEMEKLNHKKPGIFAFTSPSSFDNFLTIMDVKDHINYFSGSTICAIGLTTEEAIRLKGLTVHIVPQIFSLTGIAEAIKRYFLITANMA